MARFLMFLLVCGVFLFHCTDENPEDPVIYVLATNASPSSGGTVLRNPNQINHAAGTRVTLTAVPATGYRFKDWSGASTSTASTTTITMDRDSELTANFIRVYTFKVDIIPAGGGTVVYSPVQESYDGGTEITITATPSDNFKFVDWVRSTLPKNNTITTTINNNTTLTAGFQQIAVVDGGILTYEGQDYRTIKIGNKRWMAENLNYNFPNGGISYCYENDTSNCTRYGRLYTWFDATRACPAGWHLPSDDDWEELVQAAGGSVAAKNLKSKSGWDGTGNGTDELGFSALPGGYRLWNNTFGDIGRRGDWWSATETSYAKCWSMISGTDQNRMRESEALKTNGFSVRCIQE